MLNLNRFPTNEEFNVQVAKVLSELPEPYRDPYSTGLNGAELVAALKIADARTKASLDLLRLQLRLGEF